MLSTIAYTLFVWSPLFLGLLLLIIMLRKIMPSFIKIWLVKLVAYSMIAAYAVGFLHYTLPQRDIVLVLDAYEKRMDVSSNSMFWGKQDAGTIRQDTRDVRFIDTEMPDGSVMVYRNEDTGFGWPPYFKFDSSDLSAKAKQLVSTRDNPKWVAVRHYGWRNTVFSLFPNATSMKQVDGPDVTLIPWFNIIFTIFLALICLGIYRLMQLFKRRRIDPMVDSVEDAWDDVSETTHSMGDRVRGWFKRLGGGV
ncbi:DUF1523 family protein [Paramylibacter kogurei]|nr:DUF1523 family protein [Amylibacter kogurei]